MKIVERMYSVFKSHIRITHVIISLLKQDSLSPPMASSRLPFFFPIRKKKCMRKHGTTQVAIRSKDMGLIKVIAQQAASFNSSSYSDPKNIIIFVGKQIPQKIKLIILLLFFKIPSLILNSSNPQDSTLALTRPISKTIQLSNPVVTVDPTGTMPPNNVQLQLP
ncbi:hypothetical protein FGO68_gene16001 [Halteria grandinella]|uniref:Uncharacterized protein n=1 Tax=Halteria grandinella TaxID=5974 RepID=A0A8J8T0E6_HALGN|nr:hypothetical protein FGO68_gene16001 [Halteria grandinella]